MPLLSKPSFGPRTALIYITVGALLDVWTVVWYFWFARNQEGYISQNTRFWLTGLFFTGVVLMLIGFYLGRIGRAARKADERRRPTSSARNGHSANGRGHAASGCHRCRSSRPIVPTTGTTMPANPMLPAPARPDR